MHSIRVWVICILLFGEMTWAIEPADNAIKGAQVDLDRYEQQFKPGSTASASSINRTLKLLKLTRQRLDSSTHQSHTSWQAADQRYQNLVSNLQSALNASSAPQASTATAVTATVATPPVASSTGRQLISQDIVRLKKLLRDMQSAADTMDKGGVKPFQDTAYINQFQSAINRYQQSLGRYADVSDHPDVQVATQQLQTLDNMLAFGIEQGEADKKELGNVQANLAAVRQYIIDNPVPKIPDPLTASALIGWLGKSEQLRVAAHEKNSLLSIYREKAYLPLSNGTVGQGAAFDRQDVDSMQHSFAMQVQNMDETLHQLALNMDSGVGGVSESLLFFQTMDPTDRDDQVNHFLGDGAQQRNMQSLDESLALAQAAVVFDQRLQRPSLTQRQALKEKVEQTREDYQQKRSQALQLVRLPKSATTDRKLVKIAEQTLNNPDYAVGNIIRMVINAEQSHHSKESSEVEFDDVDVSITGKVTLSGTETTTFYEWDEFQVATAEPVGDKHYIFYNTLRYFTSGASTTPQNRWIVSARFQSSEIPKKNIKRD